MIIDGKKIALDIEQELHAAFEKLPKKSVAFVLFGNNAASLQFIGIKSRIAVRLGIETKLFHYPDAVDPDEMLQDIQLIVNQNFDGIVVQLPLLNKEATSIILNSVPSHLDIDVLGNEAFSKFRGGVSKMVPPVAAAVKSILAGHQINDNTNVLIVGDGRLVGEPVAVMLDLVKIKYSVININTENDNRINLLKNADIIISGVGIPHMIKLDMIKDGVILIDAGTSEQSGKLVGDIDPACQSKASFMTPVPGGVGPITVMSLFRNLL